MTDIDFDELDKAVNSLVGKAKSPENASTQNTSSSPHAQKASPPGGSQPQKHAEGGLLIDVVHRSQPNSESGLSSTPWQTKKTLTPFHTDITPSPSLSPKPPADTPSDTEDAPSSDYQASDWPDPLDAVPAAAPHTPPAPPTSPFLSGAKVEKRPLGAPDKPTSEKKERALQGTAPDEPETGLPKQQDTSTDAADDNLRPEFGEELAKIESDETVQSTRKDKLPEPDQTENKNVSREPESNPESTKTNLAHESEGEPSPINPPPDKPPTDLPRSAPLSGLLASSSVVSIPQQYKKTPITPEPHTDEPLFNAEHYDHPSANSSTPHHSAAHTSAWQWVLIIVGLLLLGAVLGTVVFVLVTGQSL